MKKEAWLDRLGVLVVLAVILLAFAGCMAVANAIGGRDTQTCTAQDVNAGVDRCQPEYPPELPSGTD